MKALVIRYSAMGDLLLLTGPLKALRKAKPDLKIHLLTSDVGDEIFSGSIDIDETFVLPKGATAKELFELYRQLDSYDYIFDLQGKLKSQLVRLFSWSKFYTIKKHTKERREFVKNRKYREKLNQHVVEKYYDVFKKAFDLDTRTTEELRPHWKVGKIAYDESNFDFSMSIVIHPYASQKNKVWPKFEELIARLNDARLPVVIVGYEKEQPLTIEGDQILNLTNKTTLKEMASIIATSRALISSDSGPMHLGVALDKPVVALFGPTTKEFGFYPMFRDTRVVEVKDLDCRPCHVHGGNICPLGHHRCMKDITTEEVFSALRELTSKRK